MFLEGCQALGVARQHAPGSERDFFIDNLLVRIHFVIEMIWWTGLAPLVFEFPFPGSLTSTLLVPISTFASAASLGLTVGLVQMTAGVV